MPRNHHLYRHHLAAPEKLLLNAPPWSPPPTSPYTQYLPAEFELPSAHAEGRLVTEPGDAQKYLDNGCVALQYGDNHNGSELRIAGLQDPTGRAMGLIPHPERFLKPQHHYDPDWSGDPDWGWGYYFFKGAYDAIK